MTIVPPGSGIVHQVNLEYLGRVVFNMDKVLYPDSVVGTDSHTTMINGLGIVGWGELICIAIHLCRVLVVLSQGLGFTSRCLSKLVTHKRVSFVYLF